MMRPLEVISIICCLMSCLSCTVKEDRAACPCRLILDFTGNDTVSVKSAQLLVNASEGFCLADTVICGDFKDEYTVSVPRGEVNVLSWFGEGVFVSRNEGLKIPYGEDCPEVYMDFFNIEAVGEEAMHEVRLRKNHCKTTIYVKTEEAFPYRLLIKGDVDGYSLDGLPSYGSFMYELELSETMTGHVTLPRQRDETLFLEVWDGDSVLKIFTLGRYISATGYDWSAEHLEDLTLSLDYTHNVIGITIGDWDKEHHFDISI